AIRERMVGHLLVIDTTLAETVADRLGLPAMPPAATPAAPVGEDLEPSPAPSILANPPDSFRRRQLGGRVTDGMDRQLLDAVMAAAKAEGATVEVVAPKVGGVTTSRGRSIPARQKIDGAPSVLYDAVVVLASEDGAAELSGLPPARTFLADAHLHGKFIAL